MGQRAPTDSRGVQGGSLRDDVRIAAALDFSKFRRSDMSALSSLSEIRSSLFNATSLPFNPSEAFLNKATPTSRTGLYLSDHYEEAFKRGGGITQGATYVYYYVEWLKFSKLGFCARESMWAVGQYLSVIALGAGIGAGIGAVVGTATTTPTVAATAGSGALLGAEIGAVIGGLSFFGDFLYDRAYRTYNDYIAAQFRSDTDGFTSYHPIFARDIQAFIVNGDLSNILKLLYAFSYANFDRYCFWFSTMIKNREEMLKHLQKEYHKEFEKIRRKAGHTGLTPAIMEEAKKRTKQQQCLNTGTRNTHLQRLFRLMYAHSKLENHNFKKILEQYFFPSLEIILTRLSDVQLKLFKTFVGFTEILHADLVPEQKYQAFEDEVAGRIGQKELVTHAYTTGLAKNLVHDIVGQYWKEEMAKHAAAPPAPPPPVPHSAAPSPETSTYGPWKTVPAGGRARIDIVKRMADSAFGDVDPSSGGEELAPVQPPPARPPSPSRVVRMPPAPPIDIGMTKAQKSLLPRSLLPIAERKDTPRPEKTIMFEHLKASVDHTAPATTYSVTRVMPSPFESPIHAGITPTSERVERTVRRGIPTTHGLRPYVTIVSGLQKFGRKYLGSEDKIDIRRILKSDLWLFFPMPLELRPSSPLLFLRPILSLMDSFEKIRNYVRASGYNDLLVELDSYFHLVNITAKATDTTPEKTELAVMFRKNDGSLDYFHAIPDSPQKQHFLNRLSCSNSYPKIFREMFRGLLDDTDILCKALKHQDAVCTYLESFYHALKRGEKLADIQEAHAISYKELPLFFLDNALALLRIMDRLYYVCIFTELFDQEALISKHFFSKELQEISEILHTTFDSRDSTAGAARTPGSGRARAPFPGASAPGGPLPVDATIVHENLADLRRHMQNLWQTTEPVRPAPPPAAAAAAV